MTDEQRIDFLAELTNLSVLREMGAMLTGEQARRLAKAGETISERYELHRRENGTLRAFRLAVDDAAKAISGIADSTEG
jgi:hypothetical protein